MRNLALAAALISVVVGTPPQGCSSCGGGGLMCALGGCSSSNNNNNNNINNVQTFTFPTLPPHTFPTFGTFGTLPPHTFPTFPPHTFPTLPPHTLPGGEPFTFGTLPPMFGHHDLFATPAPVYSQGNENNCGTSTTPSNECGGNSYNNNNQNNNYNVNNNNNNVPQPQLPAMVAPQPGQLNQNVASVPMAPQLPPQPESVYQQPAVSQTQAPNAVTYSPERYAEYDYDESPKTREDLENYAETSRGRRRANAAKTESAKDTIQFKAKKTKDFGEASREMEGKIGEKIEDRLLSQKCNDERLRKIIVENLDSNPSSSKRKIQKAAADQIGGLFDVICSQHDFSYLANTQLFCEAGNEDVTCFAFLHTILQ